MLLHFFEDKANSESGFSDVTLVTVDLEEHYEDIKQAKERLRNLPASQSGGAPEKIFKILASQLVSNLSRCRLFTF